MACNRPFEVKNKNGDIVSVPCGWCRQCRIDKREEWTSRLMFEVSKHDGFFLTLTYNDENLPSSGSLVPRDVQLYFKRLRQNIARSRASGAKIKYYCVGEYGDLFQRPHYHAIITGLSGFYYGDIVQKSWTLGFTKILPANPATIRYVLKYMDKQVHGEQSKKVYGDLIPPFARMSKGIGLEYFFQNIELLQSQNGFYKNGRLVPLPKYYKQKLGCDAKLSKKTDKLKYVLDYMDKHNLTYNQALNYLGNLNEIELASRDNLYKNF